MSDVNDRLPKPVLKWAALFNWRLSDAEINQVLRSPPFPEDNKIHTVDKFGDDLIIDRRHHVRRTDVDKLT